jgi:hypothetical protein
LEVFEPSIRIRQWGGMGNEYFTLSPNEAQVGEAVHIYLAVAGIVHGARSRHQSMGRPYARYTVALRPG